MISRESSENEQDNTKDNNLPSKKSKKTDLADSSLKVEVNELKQDFQTHKSIIGVETDYLKNAMEEVKEILFSKCDKTSSQQFAKEIEACRIKISQIENDKLNQILETMVDMEQFKKLDLRIYGCEEENKKAGELLEMIIEMKSYINEIEKNNKSTSS